MVTYDTAGLIPAIVQDADSGQVLMVAWMNAESLRRTHETGKVTFWSRSRAELWEKGATSGHSLSLVAVHEDCDSDTLLVSARPVGPACHTGTTSCFALAAPPPFAEFGRLWKTISDRAIQQRSGSYTSTLIADHELAARKVLEEAGEVAFAAKDLDSGSGDRTRLIEELADLTYHTLVLAKAHGVEIAEVGDELSRRS